MPNDIHPEVPNFFLAEYEDLLNALTSGTCIFIGAGVSKLAGYRVWEELLSEIIEYYWLRKGQLSAETRKRFDYTMYKYLSKHQNIIEAFDYLYFLDKVLFVSGMKTVFLRDEHNSNNAVFEALNKFNNGRNLFITTNIDKGMQDYLGLRDEMIAVFPKFYKPPRLFTYLHGKIDDEDTWIFTRGQYNKGYVLDDAPCMTFLTQVFERYNILFVGSGLREEEIMRAASFTRKRKLHWWLEGSNRGSEDFLKIRGTMLKENYNINLIPYSIDNEGHIILIKVLQELYSVLIKGERKS